MVLGEEEAVAVEELADMFAAYLSDQHWLFDWTDIADAKYAAVVRAEGEDIVVYGHVNTVLAVDVVEYVVVVDDFLQVAREKFQVICADLRKDRKWK